MENPQSRIETWAIIELFGHQQEFGYVTTMYFGSSCFLLVEVPGLPESEWPLINLASVARVNPCIEAAVLLALNERRRASPAVSQPDGHAEVEPAVFSRAYDPAIDRLPSRVK